MLADAVASAVLRRYASLPKNGKPQPGEYTLLAGFVVTEDAVPDAPPRVVALGTGTKCLPASSRCPRGEALSDSHAEVIARRAFVRFLYDELERAMEDDGDALRDAGVARDETNENAASPKPIVEWVAGESTMAPFRLRDGVRVHLYATQSPCGDASIFELANERSAARAARVDAFASVASRFVSPSPSSDVARSSSSYRNRTNARLAMTSACESESASPRGHRLDAGRHFVPVPSATTRGGASGTASSVTAKPASRVYSPGCGLPCLGSDAYRRSTAEATASANIPRARARPPRAEVPTSNAKSLL